MKKIIITLLVLTISLSTVSCKKKDSKENKTAQGFTVDANKTEINWTAYKTTDKVPVKGKFTQLKITQNTKGKTYSEALDGISFSIPVSSLFSDNPDRDNKLKTFFFGVMKNTEILSGVIHITDTTSGYVDFSMNGIVEKLPFSYSVTEKSIEIKTNMNTNTWQAQAAIESINNTCLTLHKGPDGISKTWSDVAIDISVYFK
ncbi:YceI family protein [Flavicella sp.]|uniref:YceI family protein n=1 Tax=Flavicella sp. TaxID=2957742 RepID=UPI003016AC3C